MSDEHSTVVCDHNFGEHNSRLGLASTARAVCACGETEATRRTLFQKRSPVMVHRGRNRRRFWEPGIAQGDKVPNPDVDEAAGVELLSIEPGCALDEAEAGLFSRTQ
jgi:hypothetical protein